MTIFHSNLAAILKAHGVDQETRDKLLEYFNVHNIALVDSKWANRMWNLENALYDIMGGE